MKTGNKRIALMLALLMLAGTATTAAAADEDELLNGSTGVEFGGGSGLFRF